MKKFFSILLCVILIITMTACGNSGENTVTEQPQEDNGYYSFIAEDTDGLKFKVTTDEFIANYNRAKAEHDVYGGISLSDFICTKEDIDDLFYFGTLDLYTCKYTLFYPHDDYKINLKIKRSNNSILGASVTVIDFDDHKNDPTKIEQIELQYKLLLMGLGATEGDADFMLDRLHENGNEYLAYHKGVLMYLDIVEIEDFWDSDDSNAYFNITCAEYDKIEKLAGTTDF